MRKRSAAPVYFSKKREEGRKRKKERMDGSVA